MMNKNIVLFFFLFFCSTNCIFAQFDSLQENETDTLFNNSIETLLEQNETDENDSPVLELLADSLYENENEQPSLQIRSRFQSEVQQRKGFQNGDYRGTRLKSYQRIAGAYNNFSTGVLFDKDAGEQRWNDFSTGFFSVKNIVDSISFLVGDYVAESGEGLVLWRGFDAGKSASVLSPAHRNARGIVPHLSSDEVYFFRGGAATFHFSPVSFSLFVSQRKRDATIDTLSQSASFYTAGYFRTENERTKRNALQEKTFGGIAAYSFSENIAMHSSFYRSYFDYNVQIGSGNVFSGKQFSIGSLSFDARFASIKLFGEAAHTSTKTNGKILGGEFFPVRNFTFITVWRNYDEQFFSPHGLGFGERTETSNERGIYFGFSLRPARTIKLALFYDQFSFQHPTTTIFPPKGNEALCRVEVQKSMLLYTLQLQRKQTVAREQIISENNLIASDITNTKYQARIIVDSKTIGGFSFRERIDVVAVKKDFSTVTERGVLFYGDIGKKISDYISGTVRFVFFQTDSYESRVAEFEKDLTGALSIPSLYGKGVRWYIFLHAEITQRATLQIKYSGTYRDDVKIIGSGINEFPSNKINAIGMQMEWHL